MKTAMPRTSRHRIAGIRSACVFGLGLALAMTACHREPPTEPEAVSSPRGHAVPIDYGELVPVSGVVTVDGVPLPGALIQVAPKGAPAAQGYSDSQGRFTLTTHDTNDGCYKGTHPAAVISGSSNAETGTVSPEYGDIKTSPLTVTIDGPTQDLRIELSQNTME